MNYSAMIQNRRSVHAFREKEVPSEAIGQLRSYYEKTCPRGDVVADHIMRPAPVLSRRLQRS